jgi:hypothetical protein
MPPMVRGLHFQIDVNIRSLDGFLKKKPPGMAAFSAQVGDGVHWNWAEMLFSFLKTSRRVHLEFAN